MEINITQFFNEFNPCNYSASVAEIGKNAGKITWNNANRTADARIYYPLDTPEKLQAMRDWAHGTGAWNDEIAAWSNVELNALFIQLISGDIRKKGADRCDALSAAGQVSCALFEGIDGEIYYLLEG